MLESMIKKECNAGIVEAENSISGTNYRAFEELVKDHYEPIQIIGEHVSKESYFLAILREQDIHKSEIKKIYAPSRYQF